MNKQTIFNRFQLQAIHNPNAIAIRTSNSLISYSQLEMLSARISVKLLKHNNDENKVIAIYGKRSARLIITILACARAGFTFAVLDSAYPAERINKMINVIMPTMIIGVDTADEELSGMFSELGNHIPLLSINSAYIAAVESISIDNNSMPVININPHQIAYLLFTSGTTGLPKCIKTSHRPLVHFVDWYAKTFDVKPGTKFSMLSGLGHDPILRDIFVPLSTGGEINIPESDSITNPIKLFQWVQLNNIAYIHATPQLLRLLCAGAKEGETLPHLCYVFSGGDALRISHVSELRKLANRIKVVNFYGTTETPQAMAFYEVKPNDLADPIPIGSGIDDVNVIVLNNELKSAEIGEIGQIGIETEYLSNGYLNDESLTSGKFITLSDQEHSDKNIYLTGDNGMRLSDGSIVIKGRIDDQVKIRGFRVELGEIVSALENQAEVSSAAISVQLAQNGENFLVAYLVKANASEASDDSINKLKTSLITQIPAYMIPNHYVWLDALPLLPNGKLDRAKLPKIELTSVLDSNEENIESRSNKDFLIKQWEIILNISNIDTQKSFVNLGGDSLSFIQASIAIEKNIGWLPDNWEKMPLKDINALPKKLGEKFKQVGMPIFFRALSIVLVVAGHYDILMITGSTTALFVVAGWSFGKYQIPTILQENRVKSVYLTILKIAIPTFCATLLKLLLGIKSYWWSLLLIANNFKSNKEQLAEYWFLLVLMQCLFAIAILFSFKRVRELVKENEYRFLIIATLITITLGLIGSQLFDSYALIQRVIYLKIWLVFLGMSIAFANTLEKKLTITAIAVASFVGVWFVGEEYTWFDRQPFLHPWVNHDNFMWFPLVSIFALLFISRIKIPQKIATVVYLLAESSLMIYLTNNFIQKIIKSFYPNTDSFILLFAGLVLGVVFWKIWEKISNPLWKYLDKILTKVNL